MNFIVRPAKPEDLDELYDLARQFTLLNLPYDRKTITRKVELSQSSFRGETDISQSEYLFVVEDCENKWIAGSSQIVGKSGTPESPNHSFKVLKKERFSRDLGIGFIHQVLRLNINTDGPTEVGGLVVNKSYRQRPEKVGKLVSLARFLYIALHRDRFEAELHSEMAPPLTEEGRSEFWEALGRRFTGMPYQEADALSQQNNEFIRSLFPEEDLYLCLLDAKARLVLGRVGEQTRPALHLLENIGFKYKEEVDPFDGGPHLGVATKDVTLIKNGKLARVKTQKGVEFSYKGLVASTGEEFCAGQTAYSLQGDELIVPERTLKTLSLDEGESVYFTPL